MRKLVYILIFIIGSVSIADRCLASGQENIPESVKHLPNHVYGDIRVYWREALPMILNRYLILNRQQHTYELYDDLLTSELGTYKQIGDTLHMTPRLTFYNSDFKDEWVCYELPETDTSKVIDQNLNIVKTFLIKNGGDRLIDLTTYSTMAIEYDTIYVAPETFTPRDEYIFINQNPKVKVSPLGQ